MVELGPEFRERVKMPESTRGTELYDKALDEDVFNHSKFKHYRKERRLVVEGEGKRLTDIENRLLLALEGKLNRIRNVSELCDIAIGEGYSPKLVKWHISQLRRKVEQNPKKPEIIITRRGSGYMIIDPSREVPVGDNAEGENDMEIVHFYHGLTYYPERSMGVVNGQETLLTSMENKLLDLLNRCVNRDVTLEEFRTHLWKDETEVNTGAIIKWHISHLRRKLWLDERKHEDSYKHPYIREVRGVGYRLVDPSKMENSNSSAT